MRTHILTLAFLFTYSISCTAGDIVGPRETTVSSTNGHVGTAVAAFEGKTSSGKEVSSRNFGGEVLIIDLWGLNCGSCLEEMKALEPIYREYKDKGLRIWAVNTENIGAPEMKNGLAERKMEVSYDLLVDPDLEITKNFTSWFIPVTVIVDREGIVQYYKVGFNQADAEKIKAKVEALLAR
ncbi:MAG: TlpA disulfide reductase family protein [bacterium]|nr:TlpA disulfide reductase family protein [bacterium]